MVYVQDLKSTTVANIRWSTSGQAVVPYITEMHEHWESEN